MRAILAAIFVFSSGAFAKFGERVVVRKAIPADLAALEKLFYTDEMRDLYFLGQVKSPEAWLEYSRTQPFQPFQRMRSRYYVIADPVSNEFRGIVTDVTNKDTGEHELSYAIAPEYRRNKLASEALDFMIDQAFREDPDGVVSAKVLIKNTGSSELLASKGFSLVGEYMKQMYVFELTLRCQDMMGSSR